MTILNEYRKNLGVLKAGAALICQDPNYEKWTEAEYEEAVNDAALEFAMKTHAVLDELNMLVEEDKHIYDVIAYITAANNDTPGTNKEFGFLKRVGFSGTTEPGLIPSSSMEINFTNQEMEAGANYYANKFFIDLLSPGKIELINPSADGEALDSETGNIQVGYVGLPDYMDADDEYPDAFIPPQSHDAISVGAAAILLYEGDDTDMRQAAGLEQEFDRLCRMAAGEQYAGLTHYNDCRPT